MWSTREQQLILKTQVNSENAPISSVCFSSLEEYTFFASSGTIVSQFDIRNVITPTRVMNENLDDINQITIDEKGKYLAACDDSGTIKVIDLERGKIFKTLSRIHTNACNSVQFRPRRPYELFSGGFDKLMVHWDFTRAKVIQKINATASTEDGPSMLYNPPYVYSLAVSPDGSYVASGLGDSTIGMYRFTERGNAITEASLQNAHSLVVSQVVFMSSETLISGGNDCKICIWQLPDEKKTKPQLRHVLKHVGKINWLSTAGRKLFVADISNTITEYNIE